MSWLEGYYDRQGQPLTMEAFEKLREGDRKYFRITETTLPDGKWVSTVWLGRNHNWGDGAPLIFETMVFPTEGDWGELDCERYATEPEAVAGHEAMVKKWSGS